LTQHVVTGVDQVDLAFARHFINGHHSLSTQYGLFRPHLLTPSQGSDLLAHFELEASAWGNLPVNKSPQTCRPPTSRPLREMIRRLVTQLRFRTRHDWQSAIPQGAIYLSVAQHAFEHHRFFRWLDQRRDVRPVFFVHDLLPLDFPEYFPAGYRERFMRRVKTMERAHAIITSSTDVSARIRRQFRDVNLPDIRVSGKIPLVRTTTLWIFD
jgi:hypothetical protein